MFYGIGTGVGDCKSVTVKAAEVLSALDIVYVPLSKKEGAGSVAYSIISSYLKDGVTVKERHFPMSYDSGALMESWSAIADEIEADVSAGNEVGFVTIGDPMVYSTYIYLLRLLKDRVKVATIPGITSFQDIAANHSFPLAEGDDPLIVLPATGDMDRLRRYIREENSLVIMKVYKNYRDIVDIIAEYDLLDCSIAVSNSSKDSEQVFTDLTAVKQEDVSYFTTILINKKWRKG